MSPQLGGLWRVVLRSDSAASGTYLLLSVEGVTWKHVIEYVEEVSGMTWKHVIGRTVAELGVRGKHVMGQLFNGGSAFSSWRRVARCARRWSGMT